MKLLKLWSFKILASESDRGKEGQRCRRFGDPRAANGLGQISCPVCCLFFYSFTSWRIFSYIRSFNKVPKFVNTPLAEMSMKLINDSYWVEYLLYPSYKRPKHSLDKFDHGNISASVHRPNVIRSLKQRKAKHAIHFDSKDFTIWMLLIVRRAIFIYLLNATLLNTTARTPCFEYNRGTHKNALTMIYIHLLAVKIAKEFKVCGHFKLGWAYFVSTWMLFIVYIGWVMQLTIRCFLRQEDMLRTKSTICIVLIRELDFATRFCEALLVLPISPQIETKHVFHCDSYIE